MKLHRFLCIALAVLAAATALHIFVIYKKIVTWDGRTYFLDVTTNVLWEARERPLLFPHLHGVAEYLLPWGSDVLFAPDVESLSEVVRLLPLDPKYCHRFWPEQRACIAYRDSSTEEPPMTMDYFSMGRLDDRVSHPHATVRAVQERVTRRFDPNSDEPALMLAARMLIAQQTGSAAEPWVVTERSSVVVFRGRAARYFEKVVGIATPSAADLYDDK